MYYGFKSSVPQLSADMFGDMKNFDELNALASEILTLSPADQIKFKAALQAESPTTIAEAAEIRDRLWEYQFYAAPNGDDDFFKSYLLHHFNFLAEMIEPISEPQTEPVKSEMFIDSSESTTLPEESNVRDLSKLFALNSDCIGWLSIPGTVVNYPVMYTPKNPQKYLRKNFNGEYSISGVPFVDWKCIPDSDNIIVYGHNMKNGTMFSGLKGYLKDDFLYAHQTIEFENADGKHRYTVLASVLTDKADAWYSFISAADSDFYSETVEKILNKAKVKTGIIPEYGDRLLTLSTCYGSSKSGRLIIIAKEAD